ncbi:metallophosphoesterase family protein [Jiulongibacter sp. NS-SX5]|uniref:metallophosphoesterase family protein n=1 Tax=Jiulongibacter sp. NS-SX5 TaxID=3463854 RepID=UPI004059222C
MNKKVKHIGLLKGKVLVFGGTYSNLQSLIKMKQLAEEEGIAPQNIIHTGDLIGYCASPVECTDIVEDWAIHCIKGNVEENILSGSDDCGCNYVEGGRCEMFSRSWFPFAKEQVTERNRNFLDSMPEQIDFEFAGKKCSVIHGSHSYISEFVFKSTSWKIKQNNFEALDADVILAGHCGIPFADEQADKTWLNAGVIGMPANDGTPFVWYLILDDEGGFSYQFKKYEYDNFEANQLMMEHSLPWSYAETLMTGVWDNTEILPPKETVEAGIPLQLDQEVAV